jgi:hypothetical protein
MEDASYPCLSGKIRLESSILDQLSGIANYVKTVT